MSNDKFSLKTGAAGEEEYEFDATAGADDIDRAYRDAWDSVQDDTGAVSTAKLARLTAFQRARFRGVPNPQVKAYLDAAIARMSARVSEMVNTLRVPQVNTLTGQCFRQLGYGVPIPAISIKAPRGVPSLFVGFSAQTRTMRSVGIQQMTYASLPLIDTVEQTPSYASFGGPITVNWVPLSWPQNEFDRACHMGCTPRFLMSRYWFPTTPLVTTFVQVPSVGDDAIPLQDHSLGILVVVSFSCTPNNDTFKYETAKYMDATRQLRQQVGLYA